MTNITVTQANRLIRDHGNEPQEFWTDRGVAYGDEEPGDSNTWAADCRWIRGPVTKRMVLLWLGY